jgi:hypothetical protein
MPRVSLATRNVFVYDAINDAIVAGCRQFGSTTISEFYYCLNFFFVTPAPGQYQLFHRETSSYLALNDASPLPIGNYIVCTLSTKCLNIRTNSFSESTVLCHGRAIQ